MSKLIRVSDDAYEKIRREAYEQHCSQGNIIDAALLAYLEDDPRTSEQRQRDYDAVDLAEVTHENE